MPAVVESLRGADFTFLDYKLEILLKHKDQAKAALPLLLNLMTNAITLGSPTNACVRQQVISALMELQPSLVPQPVHD